MLYSYNQVTVVDRQLSTICERFLDKLNTIKIKIILQPIKHIPCNIDVDLVHNEMQ